MNWEIDDNLTVDDYHDMETFKRKRRYPICSECKGKFVKTEEDQTICIPCRLLNGLKYVKIEIITIEIL